MNVYKRQVITERLLAAITLVVLVTIYVMVGPPGWRYRIQTQTQTLSIRPYDDHISSQGMMPIRKPRHTADEHAIYYLQSVHDMSYMLRRVESVEDAQQVEPDFKNAVAEMDLASEEFAKEKGMNRRSAALRYAPNLREAERDLDVEMNHLNRIPRAAEILLPIINARTDLNSN